MVDITEDEAVLHLKAALGELEPGELKPAPLPPPPKAPAAPAPQGPRPPLQPGALPPQQPLPAFQQAQQQPQFQQAFPPGPAGAGGSGPGAFQSFGQQRAPDVPPGIAGLQAMQHGMPPPPAALAAATAAPRPPAPGAGAPPGKKEVVFEIPQAKIPLVLGKGNAVLNAIKSYSKAECVVEQHTPDQEHARVTVTGSDKEVAKCRQTVNAVVNGKLSLATLGSLAGVSGLKEATDGEDKPGSKAPLPGPPAGVLPPGAPPAAVLAALAAAGRPLPALPGMPGAPLLPLPPGMSAAAAAAATSAQVPGMPENQQMQQNLNDYYARMWLGAYDGEENKEAEKPKDQPMAFDKEALQRLAAKAEAGDIEEPPEPASEAPPPPPEIEEAPTPFSELPLSTQIALGGQGSLEERSVAEVRAILGLPGGSLPDAGQVTDTGRSAVTPGSAPSISFGNSQRKMSDVTLKGFLRPGGTEDDLPQTKKDGDSVQKMLERLQGNVAQTKEAVGLQATVRTGPGVAAKAAFPGMMPEGDERSQADFQFEALISRAQAANNQESLDNIAREVLIRFPSFAAQQITDLVQKMDAVPGLRDHQGGDFLAELCRLLGSKLRELSTQQFTAICGAVAAWSADPKRRRAPLFAQLSKVFFTAASNEMSSRLMTFAPHELNSCLAAFVSVGFSEHKFFASVGRAALARHSSFAPVQLTALLAILSEMRLVHTDLFNAAANFLSARAKELRPVDIIRVLRSFAKCNVQHEGLCRTVSDEVVSRSKATGGTGFKAEDLCEILWALCVLEHFNADLLKILFKALEKVPMIASDALTQLFECHLALECEQKESYTRFSKKMQPEMLEALQDHYREARKDERRCAEKNRSDVASVLKSLVDGSVHVNHRTSAGFLVDVAALRKKSSRDGFIHVDLDSNVTCIRSLDQDDPAAAGVVIEGAVALRRRILQKQGLKLVIVRESQWRDMEETKEKRKHLRGLLQALGDVLE